MTNYVYIHITSKYEAERKEICRQMARSGRATMRETKKVKSKHKNFSEGSFKDRHISQNMLKYACCCLPFTSSLPSLKDSFHFKNLRSGTSQNKCCLTLVLPSDHSSVLKLPYLYLGNCIRLFAKGFRSCD